MADRLTSKPGQFLYLYGITRSEAAKALSCSGVDGRSRVETVKSSNLISWISRVDPVEFGSDLPRNMENLDWLAAASVRHQTVVAAIFAEAEILPARFGTVFRSEISLTEHIAERKADIAKSFRRLTDSEEWGVKVFALPQPARTPVAASSGADYLRKKAVVLQSRGVKAADPEIDEFAAALQRVASESAQAGRVGSGQRDLLWQTSILLPRDKREQFHALIEKYAKRWHDSRRVECTGPWPPYSFVDSNLHSQKAGQ